MRTASIIALIGSTVLSAACVSTHMKRFIGKDARYIAIEDGPPVNVVDLPDGVRAFQYRWGGGAYVVPKTTSTQGAVQLVGDAAYYSERKIESGGVLVESAGCLVTYLAKWDALKRGWIVTNVSYPKRLVC